MSDDLVENIKSILSTGHPIGSKLCYREVVLSGEKAEEALRYLREQLNGDYTLVDALEKPLIVPEEEKTPVIILDIRPFEDIHHPYFERPGVYDSLLERINILMERRPNAKVLTLSPNDRYEGIRGFHYSVDSERLISAQTTEDR